MEKEYMRDGRAPVPASIGTSRSMSSNRGRDTRPEVLLRRALRDAGLSGYRLQWKVPGRPDIAYPGKKIAIFVNGCFWHRCPICDLPLPASHRGFWEEKFRRNAERDRRNRELLMSGGWTVITVWECEIKKDIGAVVGRISAAINSCRSHRFFGSIQSIITINTIGVAMKDELRVVELFAGVGGFRVGLEKASPRFRTVWADQWEPGRKDQFAFRCYDSHFGDTGSVNVNRDINEVWKEVPEHDLLVGGFPCQDYSVASTRARGIQGKKGVLWWNIRDIIRLRRPKFVLLENVDRLLRSPVNQRGRDFGIILRCLADDGYYAEWRVVNAADYGLQQRRRRVFIFACRNDTDFAKEMCQTDDEDIVSAKGFFARTFPVSTIIEQSKIGRFDIGEKRFKDLIKISDEFEKHFFKSGVMKGSIVYTREAVPFYHGDFTTLGDLLVKDADEKYYIDGKEMGVWEYMKGSKTIHRHHKDGTKYDYTEGAIPCPDILDRAGRTMLTSEGTKSRSSHIVEDPVTRKWRMLTSIECERMNGFPDDWTNTGMSDRQRYFCMGNALVVQLITMMGKTIIDDCSR